MESQTSLGITPQAIIANSLLQLSSEELEEAVNEELASNPALDMAAPILCPYCHAPLSHGICPICTTQNRNATIRRDDEGWWNDDSRWPDHQAMNDEDDYDPFAIVPSESTLAEYLRSQINPLLIAAEQVIAEYIIDSLDEKGFLDTTVEETAAACACTVPVAEAVLRKVQSLDPAGVGARNLQECLLIQLRQMPQERSEVRLATKIIGSAWDALSKLSLSTIARQMHIPEEQVQECIDFIGHNLNPYPANADWRGPGPQRDCSPITPDIIVRRKRPPETGWEIEVPESRKYQLRINTMYQQLLRDMRGDREDMNFDAREHVRDHLAQARLFINCVRQRWQTLERIALALVDIQEEFLEKGYRYLKPLTRSQLADIVQVHESTVGRAVAKKALMLPGGRIVPLSDFFDGSLATKCVIEEIVLNEDEALSDQRIAEILQERGYDIARRTVAKYRDAIGVPPARVRATLKSRGWRPLWVPPEDTQLQ